MTHSKLLLLVAVIFAVIALVAVIFEIPNDKVYPACIALSLAFGWAAGLVP